jgi:hypothetical protein
VDDWWEIDLIDTTILILLLSAEPELWQTWKGLLALSY